MMTEDAHCNLRGILSHFHKFMKSGDYFVLEDTNPDGPLHSGSGFVYGEYENAGPAKLDALVAFVNEHPTDYRVDTRYCDMFG